jgi:riboflavin synthase
MHQGSTSRSEPAIAVDGCCLTVVASAPDAARPVASLEPEADARADHARAPSTCCPRPDPAHAPVVECGPTRLVNLEPALRAGDALGGHLVQGHVDAVGTVRSARREADGRWLDLEVDVPEPVLRLCVDRGSITVNGVSLTVMDLDEQGIRLQLIPETQARTNLGRLAQDDLVNLEADVIARYVARLLDANR